MSFLCKLRVIWILTFILEFWRSFEADKVSWFSSLGMTVIQIQYIIVAQRAQNYENQSGILYKWMQNPWLN